MRTQFHVYSGSSLQYHNPVLGNSNDKPSQNFLLSVAYCLPFRAEVKKKRALREQETEQGKGK